MVSSIGLYDSGLGGLSVMQAVATLLPAHDLLYLADTAFCPYGLRPVEDVQRRAVACTEWLIRHGARVVVVACNTATSAAVEVLRATFAVPIVGMEPGIKPAIAATRTHQIGVLATNGTLQGPRFATLVQRFAADIGVHTIPCPGLVEQVERGDLRGPATQHILLQCLAPLAASNVDTIVLGCTHFHFIQSLLAEIAEPHQTIIDTAPAVARRVESVAAEIGFTGEGRTRRCATTGDPSRVAPIMAHLWGGPLPLEFADC